jgi:hypothetical protein
MEEGMQEERNTPQDEDEVEAHRQFPAPEEPGRSALDEDEDEVEAHRQFPAPSERQFPEQSE